jgi:hypothetical protein
MEPDMRRNAMILAGVALLAAMGVAYALVSAGDDEKPAADAGSPTPGPGVTSTVVPAGPGMQLVRAPIDAAAVRTLESAPPQYVVHVTSGLPSGCAKASGYEVERKGDVIDIRVFNAMPTDQRPCTMIYGIHEFDVALGGGFTAGHVYTVQVNDRQVTFTGE